MEAKEFRSKQSPCIGEQRGVEWCQRPGHPLSASARDELWTEFFRFHVLPLPFLPPPHCVMGFLHYRVCLGVVTFFAELIFPARTFHNTALLSYEPEPSKTYSSKRSKKTNPKSKPSRSLHLHEILEKRGKTMWRFYFFCSVSFPSQNLPQHSPFELRTRTFQKPTTGGEAKNKPKAHTFQKPTPDWDTIHRGKNHVAFSLFLLSSFSQPEPSTTQPIWVTNQEASRSLHLKEKPKTNPKLKPSRSLHLNEML